MKKIVLLSFLSLPFIASCSTAMPMISSSSVYASPMPYLNDYNPTPSSTPYVPSVLQELRAGVLPDSGLSNSETKLAGMLVRQTKPIFPLKIGVLLYKKTNALEESDRRKNFDTFIAKLKTNSNIGQIIEISPNLISSTANLEEIRSLGARFQVASILIINENYQYPEENKEAVVTPIDQITGARTWESFTNIEVYSLDILNGVMLFSTTSGAKQSEKYNRQSSTITNPDSNLIRNASNIAWRSIEDKVSNEINDYKKRLDENKVIPVSLDNKI